MQKFLIIAAFLIPLSFAHADDLSPPPVADTSVSNDEGEKSLPAPPAKKIKSKKPMKMDEPMPTGMAKEGMMKGDVKASAAQKEAEMEKLMQQEEMHEQGPTPEDIEQLHFPGEGKR